ncbi:ribosomal RNA-processing protein 7-domain-containing protein [Amylocarpus encephaloides]|uniref:Ribosomal RNA-processing protein 7-domain-containing protein n=1 Tax=Amylocarpus encephaloides TaxID=45428 RepID=A0A9P7YLC5_9HELO|nr:ribosomal RNA-processing protein 7-domain-containing protein [Amylocarpus encephaloides]
MKYERLDRLYNFFLERYFTKPHSKSRWLRNHKRRATPLAITMVSTIKSYTILPIIIPSTPAFSKATTHTLYLQPHTPKIPTEADSRSLFLVNVPVDSTAVHLRGIFANLLGAVGRVDDVLLDGEKNRTTSPALIAPAPVPSKKRKRVQENANLELDDALPEIWDRSLHRSGSTAIVVFVDTRSAEAVLKAITKIHKSEKSGQWPTWGAGIKDKVPTLGSARYANHHTLRYPDTQTLQMNVDAFMTVFNAREETKKLEDGKRRNMPDEDGFVTVTRGGRIGPARREDAEEKRKEMEEREEKKRMDRESEGFYRFQVREKRKKEQGELIKQFEEDKRRVEKLREVRGRKGKA